jgi:hypothetical protein
MLINRGSLDLTECLSVTAKIYEKCGKEKVLFLLRVLTLHHRKSRFK